MANTEIEINTPPGEPVIEVRRFFKAPPELLFRVLTEGEFLRRWWGPRRLVIAVCEVDLRVGGSWRLVHRAPDGTEFAFHGKLLEFDPPRRRVGTWTYEGWPEHEATETLELEPVEGGTILTSTMVHDSVESRDMHVASGMETGIIEGYERLDEILAEEQGA